MGKGPLHLETHIRMSMFSFWRERRSEGEREGERSAISLKQNGSRREEEHERFTADGS